MAWTAVKMKCCGITEIYGFNSSEFSPRELFRWIAEKFQYNSRCNADLPSRSLAGRGQYILTYAYNPHAPGNGRWTLGQCNKRQRELKTYVTKNKLGKVIVLPDVGNPNYQGKTMIRTFVIIPDHDGIFDLCKKEKWDKPKLEHVSHFYFIEGQ